MPQEDVAGITELLQPNVELIRGDVTDHASMESAVQGCQRVVHLAAVVGDWGPDELFDRVNVGGTRNVVDAAAHEGVKRLVMISSIVVYGARLHDGGCDEDAPHGAGVGPYSRTKRES